MAGKDGILTRTAAARPAILGPRLLLLAGALLLGSGAAAYLLAPSLTSPQAAPSPIQSPLARLLTEYAAQIDSTAPAAQGPGVTLVGASASGERLVLRLRLDEDVSADDLSSVQSRRSASDLAELCRNPEMRLFIDEGATIERSYTDAGGDPMRTETRSCARQAPLPQGARVPMAM